MDCTLRACAKFESFNLGLIPRTQITSQAGFLDHDFYNPKNSVQDESNVWSNLILSSLEVGHCVAQT